MEFFTVRASFIAAGALELALAVVASRWIGRDETYPVYLSLYFAMAAPWLVASYLAFSEPSIRRLDKPFVLAVAILLRLTFAPTPPVLSDDVFRYIWDGRVQHAGVNPYLHPPDAPELDFLRDDLSQGINNKDIPTIYPPLMQAAFFAVTALSESILAMKVFFVLVELALVMLLFRLLEALSLNPLRGLVYAWSPLSVVETSASGHNDVLGVLFLVAALYAFECGRRSWSMVLLSCSGAAKLLGFALAPLFARYVKLRQYAWLAIPAICFSAPYASAGWPAFRGLVEYGERWRGNDSLFHVLFALTGTLERAKMVVAIALVAMVLVLVRRKTSPLRASFWTVSAILLLTPVAHPWYFLWVLPFLAVFSSPAWMFLSVSAGLSYHSAYLARAGAPWEDLLWVKALEYVPFFVLLAGTALGRLSRNDTRATP